MRERYKRFAEEYIRTLNATQSAIVAGYSKKGAGNKGYELLRISEIQEYIKSRMDKADKNKIASADEVLETLTGVMRGEVTALGLDTDVQDRVKAAELLGKRYALFTDKTELSGAVDIAAVLDARRMQAAEMKKLDDK
jgi:phage terminase small subunit